MKKAISMLLALVLCLSLSACGKSKSVKNAEDLIDAIGEITSESGDTIAAAESAYNALTDDEKSKVENYAQLEDCKVEYAAKIVEDMIDAIGEITVESCDAIAAAESAYNALTDNEKSRVDNYAQLETYKVEYEEYMTSSVADAVDDLDYYSYNQRYIKGALLDAYFDYMTDEQKKECLALYLFYVEAPDYVEETIKNSLKNPSSYTLYDMEVESVITYNEEKDTFTGWIDITYGGTNSFGGMVKESADVWVEFSVNIETKSISFRDITIWDF